jgi:hypothetical protein
MSTNEMWDSAVRSAGDMAGVFEFDGDSGYFYLHRTSEEDGQKVKGAIHVISGTPDFGQEDINIRWTADQEAVGLFIRSQLWAVFDCKTGAKYGGNYRAGNLPEIPLAISRFFA